MKDPETPAQVVATLRRLDVRGADMVEVARRIGVRPAEGRRLAKEIRSGDYDYGRVLLADLVRDAAPELKRFLFDSPDLFAITSAYLPGMNACSFHSGNGGWVIVVDPRLVAYLYKLARVLCTRVQFIGTPETSLMEMSETTELAREILESLISTGSPYGRDFELDAGRIQAASNLASEAERFVVGHELGHHLLGHVYELGQRVGGLAADAWDWHQEYEADEAAARLVLSRGNVELTTLDGNVTAGRLAGIHFALAALAVLEDYRANRARSAPISTHPPAQGRLDRLRAQLELMFGPDFPRMAMLGDSFGNALDWIRDGVGLLPASWESLPTAQQT